MKKREQRLYRTSLKRSIDILIRRRSTLLLIISLKREKSLAILSLNLVQYFYENNFVQTLEDTAQKFTDTEGTKLKTKIRRLYDITNVFKSLGLIKKISSKSRKIAIQWRGNKSILQFRDRRV